MKKNFDFVITLVIALLLVLFVRTYVIQFAYVPTPSMVPTIPVPSLVLEDKFFKYIPTLDHIRRGDVIIFNPPFPTPEKPFIKRVIGVPGDHIAIHDRHVWINGYAINEPYTIPVNYQMRPVVVPPGEYFVLGDNRPDSFDSHMWLLQGISPFVPASSVQGIGWLVLSRNGIHFLHENIAVPAS